jgi:hypothetical protein
MQFVVKFSMRDRAGVADFFEARDENHLFDLSPSDSPIFEAFRHYDSAGFTSLAKSQFRTKLSGAIHVTLAVPPS